MSLFDFFRHGGATDRLNRAAAGNREASIPSDKLSGVLVVTIDEGPFMNAAFCWLIGSDEKPGCVFPLSGEGLDESLAKQLAGFDAEVVSTAKGSTSNARFVC